MTTESTPTSIIFSTCHFAQILQEHCAHYRIRLTQDEKHTILSLLLLDIFSPCQVKGYLGFTLEYLEPKFQNPSNAVLVIKYVFDCMISQIESCICVDRHNRLDQVKTVDLIDYYTLRIDLCHSN